MHEVEQKPPAQWQKFLKYGPNKESLVQFLFECWRSYTSMMLNGIILYVCHGNQCHRLLPAPNNAPITVEEATELTCDHEEADTRLLLHASHASQSYENILIKSPDTDVFIISLHFCLNFRCRLFF